MLNTTDIDSARAALRRTRMDHPSQGAGAFDSERRRVIASFSGSGAFLCAFRKASSWAD